MSVSSQTFSQEDSSSMNSRSSMEFVTTPLPDDKERLLHIDSAIRWIKDELVSRRIIINNRVIIIIIIIIQTRVLWLVVGALTD